MSFPKDPSYLDVFSSVARHLDEELRAVVQVLGDSVQTVAAVQVQAELALLRISLCQCQEGNQDEDRCGNAS